MVDNAKEYIPIVSSLLNLNENTGGTWQRTEQQCRLTWRLLAAQDLCPTTGHNGCQMMMMKSVRFMNALSINQTMTVRR